MKRKTIVVCIIVLILFAILAFNQSFLPISEVNAQDDGQEVLIDSFENGAIVAYSCYDLHPSDSVYRSALSQSFTMKTDGYYRISKVRVTVGKSGSPTGYAYAKLYSHNGTYGTNSSVNELLATSEPFDCASLTVGGFFRSLTFNTTEQYLMQPNNYYVIVWENPSSGTIDSSNFPWLLGTVADEHSGNWGHYVNGTWATNSTRDLEFEVYGIRQGGSIVADNIDLIYPGCPLFPFTKRLTFRANGRDWIFFAGYKYGLTNKFQFSSSTDGVTWAAVQNLSMTGNQGVERGSVWYDGTYVHLILKYLGNVTYRMATPESNGSLTYITGEASVEPDPNSSTTRYIDIVCDSEGYPWITSNWSNATAWYYSVIKSDWKNGSWQTSSGFPKLLAVGNSSSMHGCQGLALQDGKMYVLYRQDLDVRGALWDGSSWGAEEIATKGIIPDTQSPHFQAVAYRDDVYLVYEDTYEHKEYWITRTYGEGWASNHTFLGLTYSQITLTVDETTGKIFMFQRQSSWVIPTGVQYRTFFAGEFSDWIPLTYPDQMDGWHEYSRQSFYKVQDNKIGVFWSERPDGNCRIMFYALDLEYKYVLKGLYDEDTADLLLSGVNVTAHYTNTLPYTFEVNGTYTYYTAVKPLYFSFNLSNPRQYWLSPTETTATIYILETTTTVYTIQFLDLAGALDDYPFIEIKRYNNASLTTVEKRKADAADKIQASLKQGEKYTLEIKDGSCYTFGDVLFTSDVTVTLTLKGVEFPQNIILAYRYVRIYGYRHNNFSSISITFEETQSRQCDVEIDIQFENGTSVSGSYPYTYNDQTSFNHTWASAVFNTTYVVKTVIDHPTYGEMPYNTILARGAFTTTPPWTLPFPNIPNLTADIIPLVLIFGSFLLFSRINAYVAAFVGVGVAILLTWFGWINIPATFLLSGLVFAILMAMSYKRKESRI